MSANNFKCDCNAINYELVEATLREIPEDEVFLRLADFYKIIGNSTRLKILFSLMLNEMCVCDLANVLSMSKSSVSHQLSKMREFGVVKCRREGKEVYYSLDDEHVSESLRISTDHMNHKH